MGSSSDSSPYDELRKCKQLEKFPNSISHLKNLEKVDFNGFVNFKENDLLKISKSLKSLTFGNFVIPQFIINELSTLINLEELTFMRTTINEELNLEPIKKLNKLHKLNISNSNSDITVKKYFKIFPLKYFVNLKELYINEYTLAQIDIDYIASLANIKELTFSYCGYDKELNLDPLKNLKNLEALNIIGSTKHCSDEVNIFNEEKCPLKEIPSSIYFLANLKKLVLNNQSGVNFNAFDLLQNLRNLEYLDLSYNSFKKIIDSIGELKNLKYLNIEHNNINTLPKSIGNLKNLQEIKLNDNKIKALPETFENLKNLRNIDLRNNNISGISNSLVKLQNLEYLNLESNNIVKLPEHFSNLESLKELYLYKNKITTLPDSFGNLKNLKILHIQHNNIEALPNSIGNLISLKELDLYQNKINIIPETFGKLKSLEKLDLSCNNIENLPNSIGELKNLKELEIHDNQLKNISKSLGNLKKLTSLNLSSNVINDEIPISLNNLPVLHSIFLGNNINIKGKTLTNKSLMVCNYGKSVNGDIYSLCKSQDMYCLEHLKKQTYPPIEFEPCSYNENHSEL
jgi:Leucine-rich repeat (LRR) protein